jgi:flagellar biosynthesis protein
MAFNDPKLRRTAIALGYDQEKDHAPQVLAAGRGELAETLLRIARANSIPIQENHPLAGALIALDVGDFIPPELYQAVAEVLAFLSRLEQEKMGGRS